MMKGIYLTEEAASILKAKVQELIKESTSPDIIYTNMQNRIIGEWTTLNYIVNSATILPVEKSWKDVNLKTDYGLSDEEIYPNGVIIEKQYNEIS